MLRKISLRMALTYGLIIIITLILLDFILIYSYEKEQLRKNEAKYLVYGNIIANIVKEKFDDSFYLNKAVRRNGGNIEGRILIINNKSKVLADKFTSYLGKTITNPIIRKSFEGKAKSVGYYARNGKHIMTVTVPIIDKNCTRGLVLISQNIDNIYKDIESLKKRTIQISTLAGILAIILSLIFGKKLSKPIEKLTKASEKIQKGKLNTRVNICRKDEIGKLAQTFNKMGEEIHRTDINRRRFISDVSHELKTPLASMKALIESLIYGENEISVHKEYLTYVNYEIDRLSVLVKSLLTVTKLDELDLKKENINLCNEIQAITKLFRSLLNNNNLSLINKCEKDQIIYGDKDRFKEVLINLIDNSIKYGKYNGYIEISFIKDKEKVFLLIKDNGKGIPEKDLPYIFENFYRVDKSRSRDIGSSGIGLHIVKKIIELHGWTIDVRSKLGVGTEFVIEIKD